MSPAPSGREDQLLAKWPENLKERVVRRDFVLVVGAGISRNASSGTASPPSWGELLDSLTSKFTTGAVEAEIRELSQARQFLDAAEIIRLTARASAREPDFLRTICELTDGPANAPFLPSAIHNSLISLLEPQIIVTTNFDKLLERTSSGYHVHRPGGAGLAADIRTGYPVIVKAHGTVDESESIVLTRSDFASVRRKHRELYDVLQALMLTRTALFVGYSFQDPDILLLLENLFGGAGQVGAHYWLAPDNGPEYLRTLFRDHYGIQMIEYGHSANHGEMAEMLEVLGEYAQASA